MTKDFQTHNFGVHQVTDAWHAQNIAPHPDLEHQSSAELEETIKRLLELSNQRPLSALENDRLQAATRVRNVNRALHVVHPRPLSDFEFEGIDQIHGNSIQTACGCKLHVIFDHHKAIAGEPHVHHPHHPLKVCDKHAHLKDDFKAHHAAVIAEHQ